jgi:hypothetical protein
VEEKKENEEQEKETHLNPQGVVKTRPESGLNPYTPSLSELAACVPRFSKYRWKKSKTRGVEQEWEWDFTSVEGRLQSFLTFKFVAHYGSQLFQLLFFLW